MSVQNIYDNEIFFSGYSKIRENKSNANELFEKPALFSLLPALKDKTVLDLGCGYGEHCMRFVKEGAKKVTGIDISQKMLAVAKAENAHQSITYLHMPMEDIGDLQERFDIVVSSLAFHYVEDFQALIKNIYGPNGNLPSNFSIDKEYNDIKLEIPEGMNEEMVTAIVLGAMMNPANMSKKLTSSNERTSRSSSAWIRSLSYQTWVSIL